VFEWASVKATRPEVDYNIDALLARIKTLEEKIEKGEFTCKSVSPVQTAKEEIKEEPNFVTQEEKEEELVELSSIPADVCKARILSYLRKNNSEMLWNVIQTVKISIDKNTLVLTPTNNTDAEILIKDYNQEKIVYALEGVKQFEIKVEEYHKEKLLSEVDDATERLKKIFGDDIVIIKK
jgi:hypothetical protein